MFQKELRLNFFNCDPAGIIFYSQIFEMSHQVYEEFFESLELPMNFFDSEKFVLPIIHTEADYLQPLKPADKTICTLNVGQLRDSSFELQYSFSIGETVHAKVSTVHVCVLKDNFIKTELPEFLRSALEAHRI